MPERPAVQQSEKMSRCLCLFCRCEPYIQRISNMQKFGLGWTVYKHKVQEVYLVLQRYIYFMGFLDCILPHVTCCILYNSEVHDAMSGFPLVKFVGYWLFRVLSNKILEAIGLNTTNFEQPTSSMLKLSFTSTRVLVSSWLFCIQYFPYSMRFWCTLEPVWRFEQRTFYISSFRAKLILACQEGIRSAKWTLNPTNLLTDSKHTPKPHQNEKFHIGKFNSQQKVWLK